MFCVSCGAQVADTTVFCPKCGSRVASNPPTGGGQPAAGPAPSPAPQPSAPQPGYAASPAPQPGFSGSPAYGAPPIQTSMPPQQQPIPGAAAPKSKLVAGLLGILLGAFGVHRFYLGYNTIAIIQLVLGLLGILTCGITTIASGIWGLIDGIMILTGSINTDAKGQPLAD